MKYGITQQLPAVQRELAQRFHVAMLRRMYQVQLGASPALEDPLDAAIALMHRWATPPDLVVQALECSAVALQEFDGQVRESSAAIAALAGQP